MFHIPRMALGLFSFPPFFECILATRPDPTQQVSEITGIRSFIIWLYSAMFDAH